MLNGALMVAPVLIEHGKKAWLGYKGAKAVLNTALSFRRAPEEMEFTFQMYACLLEALEIAEPLAVRHASMRLVGSAVILARSAILRCQLLMESADVDDAQQNWSAWIDTGRKKEELMRVQARLSMATNSLNLALSAVAASPLPRGFAASPFARVPQALDDAHTALNEMLELRRTSALLLWGQPVARPHAAQRQVRPRGFDDGDLSRVRGAAAPRRARHWRRR